MNYVITMEENFDFYRDNILPNSDGITNSCRYSSLGITDHFISGTDRKLEERKFVKNVQNIIEEFSKKFDRFRNVKSMPDVYDAYNVLPNNNLLKNQFDLMTGNYKNGFLENWKV